MNINDMKRKDFEALPHRNWQDEMDCDSVVIIPGHITDMHDSGYRAMDFAAVVDGEAICLLSGCSDVVHIDGIGGFGYDWLHKYRTVPPLIPPSGWSIDCLPKSGFLRLFPSSGRVHVGVGLSSFEIYALPRKEV
jgi:hypothetical protein